MQGGCAGRTEYVTPADHDSFAVQYRTLHEPSWQPELSARHDASATVTCVGDTRPRSSE